MNKLKQTNKNRKKIIKVMMIKSRERGRIKDLRVMMRTCKKLHGSWSSKSCTYLIAQINKHLLHSFVCTYVSNHILIFICALVAIWLCIASICTNNLVTFDLSRFDVHSLSNNSNEYEKES